MTFVVAGVLGFGAPQFVVIALVFLAVVFSIGVLWGKSKKRDPFSHYCPKCGRGLDQPADAKRCSYCGAELP